MKEGKEDVEEVAVGMASNLSVLLGVELEVGLDGGKVRGHGR